MAQFLFNKDKLVGNVEMLQEAFLRQNVEFQIFYSVKTNFSEQVLETINNHCSFEIVSAYEWEKVKKYKPQELVLNGPSKSLALVKDILSTNIKTLYFNIDNDTDTEMVKRIDPELKKKVKIGLRVYLNRPGIWNRFGFDIESKKAEKIAKLLGDSLDGIHFHFSTNNFRLENYIEMLKAIRTLVDHNHLKLDYIDIGGGLPGASDMLFQRQYTNNCLG